MKPGPRGLEAIKEALIAKVPRRGIDNWEKGKGSFNLEDWIMDQLQGGEWIVFNPEKAKDINYMYKLRREIIEYFS